MIVSPGKDLVWVRLEDGSLIAALVRTKSRESEFLVPGDHVELVKLDKSGNETDVLFAIGARSPRRSEMRRTARNRERVVAANLDCVIVVQSIAQPAFEERFIDTAIASAIADGLQTIVVLTKMDFADAALLERLTHRYAAAEQQVYPVNGLTGEGVAAFSAAIQEKVSVMVGPSGAGKSTLWNRFGGKGRVGEVSRFGFGKQTTTMSHVLRVGSGSLFDLPGVASYANAFDSDTLLASFPEFKPFTAQCQYADCFHLKEPNCAVKTAVLGSIIDDIRYTGYRNLAESIQNRIISYHK
ncbi:MAG TPA: ribosome small subunit-dependent GTPase A [Candidatus Baltobacteraceae bacterium]|jgi:ribosome biogenesis GTPase|nr:ribosome small subunit-dependent GTPase A [Candidatus Baltobacteraceae bacterium]